MSDRRAAYHHGDLKAALIDGAVTLIAERGVRGFSLAELSRRLGVTVAAPYRHFADREELLAAVAVRALHAFRDALAAQSSETDPPERRLAAMAAGYVRFAAEQPALFGVVFDVGLDKKERYPELRQAYENVERMLEVCVAELCPRDPDAAEQLAEAIEATAHGYAALLIDQPGSPDPADIDRVVEQAARTVRALIQGRAALRGPADRYHRSHTALKDEPPISRVNNLAGTPTSPGDAGSPDESCGVRRRTVEPVTEETCDAQRLLFDGRFT